MRPELHFQNVWREPCYLRMAISMLKIRRPLGHLIFNMGIAIPGKTVFLIETAPSIPSKILTANHSFVLFLHCNDCCNSLLFISVCIPIQTCISAFCHQRYQYCWQGSLKIFLNSPGWLNMAKYYHFQCICKGNTSVLPSFTNKASIKDILQALIIMCYSSAPQSSERTWMYMTNS